MNTFTDSIVICPTAKAQHATDYKISRICMSISLSVYTPSYDCNFYLVVIRFCAVIQGLHVHLHRHGM